MENVTTLTAPELRATISTAIAAATSDKELIHGIDGLAKLLNCCRRTAQKYKNSNKIPFIQLSRRKIVFIKQDVLRELKEGGNQ